MTAAVLLYAQILFGSMIVYDDPTLGPWRVYRFTQTEPYYRECMILGDFEGWRCTLTTYTLRDVDDMLRSAHRLERWAPED